MKHSVAIYVGALGLLAQLTAGQLAEQAEELARQLRGETSIRVTTAAELMAAVKTGGTVQGAAGTYVVNLVLERPVTVRGPAGMVLVPLDPLQPTVQVTGNDISVFGLTIQNGAPDREAVTVGSATATSVDAQPHHVRFTGVSVMAKSGGHRGFALHGVDITLDRVTVTGFYEKGRDSQAVWICNGPGPYAILDSVLEASGENILVGGADPRIIGMNPADITIRGNTLRKPDIYRQLGTVKNLFELKTGVRVLFEGNILDGNWRDGQDGTPIQITVRNQDGRCPWCQVDDVTLRQNTVRNTREGFAINILGRDDTHQSRQTQRIAIAHNLFRDSPMGIQVLNGVEDGLTVTHNTFPAITVKALSFDKSSGLPKVLTPLTYSDNVMRGGVYGVTGDGSTTVGLPSLLAWASIEEWKGNLIETTDERTIAWPAGTTLIKPAGLAALLDPKTFKLLTGTAGY